MNNMETETQIILSELPNADKIREDFGTTSGSAYFKVPKPNAWIAISKDGNGTRIEIYPTSGGLLATATHNLAGDLAPFCD